MTASRGAWWWLAAAAVHVTLLALFHLPEAKAPLGDERMYLRAAAAVVEEGHSDLGPLWPPAYAWFLAPLVALGAGSLWLVQLAQTVLLVLAALLVRRLVRRELEDAWAADLAGWLVVAYPPLAAYAHYLWPEVLHLALMLAAVTLLLRDRGGVATAVGGGLLLALCLQAKVLLLPFLLPLAVGLWWRWPPRRRLLRLAALFAALGIGVLPTVVAQNRDFGRPMLANSGLFNLWVGLNDVSKSDFRNTVVGQEYARYAQSARSTDRRDRILEDKIRRLVNERGLRATFARQIRRQYFRLFHRDSFFSEQLVGGAVWERGDGYRSGASLPARLATRLSHASWAGILLFAAWGIALFPYGRRPFGWWVLGFLLAQCALFLVLHVKTRYRVQMLPGFFFFAAYGAATVRAAWRGARQERPVWPLAGPWRYGVGFGLGGLLLFLAFGG